MIDIHRITLWLLYHGELLEMLVAVRCAFKNRNNTGTVEKRNCKMVLPFVTYGICGHYQNLKKIPTEYIDNGCFPYYHRQLC